MKSFVGLAGQPVLVWVSEPGETERKLDGDLAWGDKSQGSANLALVILKDVLGDDMRAIRLHRRFMYRTCVNWKKDGNWSIGESEIRQHIAAIEETDATMVGPARAVVATDLPPMVHDGGIGPGGSRVEWDQSGAVGEKRPGKP